MTTVDLGEPLLSDCSVPEDVNVCIAELADAAVPRLFATDDGPGALITLVVASTTGLVLGVISVVTVDEANAPEVTTVCETKLIVSLLDIATVVGCSGADGKTPCALELDIFPVEDSIADSEVDAAACPLDEVVNVCCGRTEKNSRELEVTNAGAAELGA